MDEKEKLRLQKIYKNELSDEDLIGMALTKPEEFDEGVYELVMNAVRKRELEARIEEIKQIEKEQKEDKNWIEVYRYYDEFERECVEGWLKGKDIPANVFSRECSAYDGIFRNAIGGGVILVREDYVEAAKIVIADFEKTKGSENES